MLRFIVSSILLIMFLSSFLYASAMWLKNKKLIKSLEQCNIDNEIIGKHMLHELKVLEDNESKAKDDFIKFLSESREWSYSYIEDAQKTINNFINEIKPEIDYFDEYGVVGSSWPHYYSMKKISTAYKELKNLLPEDYGKID